MESSLDVPASGARASHWTAIRSSPWWIAGLALIIRVAWIIVGHTYRFKTKDDNFSFGWEMGRIAMSLASGHGFSNQFGPPTGPTAWEPPLYPFLAAGVFRVFIARRIFSQRVAIASTWAWALLPNVIFWCTRSVWETTLSALLLAVILWLALTMEEREGWIPWFGFGLLWGIVALNSPSLLAFLPGAGLWSWYRRAKFGKPSFAGVVLASIVFFATISPWLVRNYQTFGRFIFIRDNFGAELRLGNGNGADGTLMLHLDPMHDPGAMQQFQSMGELNYIDLRKQQALAFIKTDYLRFAHLSAKRFLYFWSSPPKDAQPGWLDAVKRSLFLGSSVLMFWGLGRAIRLHKPGAWLLAWLLLTYPTMYYFVYSIPRYRVPIEPELAILAVFLIMEARRVPPSRMAGSANRT